VDINWQKMGKISRKYT